MRMIRNIHILARWNRLWQRNHGFPTLSSSGIISSCRDARGRSSIHVEVNANASQNEPVRFVTYSITKPAEAKRSSKKTEVMINRLMANAEDNEPMETQLVSDKLRDHTLLRSKEFEPHLSMFVMLCQSQGEMDVARKCVNTFILNNLRQKVFSSRALTSPAVPNMLLKCYGDQGDFMTSMALYELMLMKSLVPDKTTYAWLLLAALNQNDQTLHHQSVETVLERMRLAGKLSDLKDILVSSDLVMWTEYRRIVKQGLAKYCPDIHISTDDVSTENAGYNNKLVENLNKSVVAENPYARVLDDSQIDALLKKQLEAELRGRVIVESIDKRPPDRATLVARKLYEDMKREWVQDLTQAVRDLVAKRSQVAINNPTDSTELTILPFLKAIPEDKIVKLLVHEAERLCEMSEFYSPTTSSLSHYLGRCIPLAFANHKMASDKHSPNREFIDGYKRYIQKTNEQKHHCNYRLMYMKEDTGRLYDRFTHYTNWSTGILSTLGGALFDIMINTLKLPKHLVFDADEGIPAFYTVYRMVNNKTQTQLKPHPSLITFIKKAQPSRIIMNTDEVPMIVPPVPWFNQTRSAYAMLHAPLVRVDRENYFGNAEDTALNPVFDALNVLGACPWVINKPILDLVMQVYHDGGDDNLGIPENIEKTVQRLRMDVTDPAAVLLIRKAKMESFSNRSSFMLSLSVANHFKDNVFWMPHNVDFRGRAYPLSAHVSQVSSDPRRAMLRFAKGKPLGERGLEWLKIHLVNLTGYKKKESNSTRLAYANEVLPLALQCAATPFEGKQWWMEADEPWQTLATCMELKAAYESGDPTKYISHLPIHQDGSCNGLQHYAAMGRDKLGAESVNVSPSPKPHDVYIDVAQMIDKMREKDALAGDELAKSLEGHITRKVVKQSVMTTVYGVTEYGTFKQVMKQLADQIPDHPLKWRKQAANYISDRIADSMGTIFSSSTQIQNWLTLLAHVLTTTTGKPVAWETPLGLPVTQHYWTKTSATIQSEKPPEKPNSNKQKNGFPPNFIHSLDSTHMMLTALNCEREGIAFVSIHDCFWTHACDVDKMNKICRQAFVDLYSQPILEDLSNFVRKHYIDKDNPAHKYIETILNSIPRYGEFKIEDVKQSEYFFS